MTKYKVLHVQQQFRKLLAAKLEESRDLARSKSETESKHSQPNSHNDQNTPPYRKRQHVVAGPVRKAAACESPPCEKRAFGRDAVHRSWALLLAGAHWFDTRVGRGGARSRQDGARSRQVCDGASGSRT
eukprot:6177045-Pleurochrysis_carterae.AAC.1